MLPPPPLSHPAVLRPPPLLCPGEDLTCTTPHPRADPVSCPGAPRTLPELGLTSWGLCPTSEGPQRPQPTLAPQSSPGPPRGHPASVLCLVQSLSGSLMRHLSPHRRPHPSPKDRPQISAAGPAGASVPLLPTVAAKDVTPAPFLGSEQNAPPRSPQLLPPGFTDAL